MSSTPALTEHVTALAVKYLYRAKPSNPEAENRSRWAERQLNVFPLPDESVRRQWEIEDYYKLAMSAFEARKKSEGEVHEFNPEHPKVIMTTELYPM